MAKMGFLKFFGPRRELGREEGPAGRARRHRAMGRAPPDAGASLAQARGEAQGPGWSQTDGHCGDVPNAGAELPDRRRKSRVLLSRGSVDTGSKENHAERN